MTRQRKIDEELWEDSDEKLSSDHVVERFFSQHQRDAHDAHDIHRKGHSAARPRRSVTDRPEPEADE